MFNDVLPIGQGKNTYYEEDLCPGDIFGETALSGMHSRMMTVMAITNVDLLVIDDQDFMMAQDRDSMHMGTEERAKYLSKVPMFRNWDSYKLLRLAHVLVQEEIEKKTLLIQHGQVNRDLYFIVQGRVDILDHLEKRHIITSLTTNDFLGESGFCNRFTKAVNRKVKEEFYAVAVTKLDVLVLHDANFALFDVQSIDLMKTAFLAKLEWRRSRVKTMKVERAKVRKKYFLMHAEADRMLTSGASSNPTTTTVTIHRNDSPPRTMQTNETEYVEQVLQRRGDEDVDYEYRDYYEFFDSNGEVQEAQSPKPSSGLPSVPQSPFRSSFPVKQENPRNETARISATDTAYHSALVHPLDDRLNNPNQWIGIGTVEEQKTKSLKFVQEIPTIMAKDFDLLMVSASLKNHKQFTKIQDLVFHGKKTVSPKRQQAQHQMTLSRRTNSSPFASRINSKNNSRNNSRPASATASRPASAMKRFEQPKLEMPSLEESIPQFFVQTLHKHEVSNEQNDYSHVAPGRIRPSSANARINVVEDNQTKPPAIHKGSTIVKIPSHQHLSSSQHRPLSASAAPMRLPPHQQRIYDDQQNRAALKVLEEAQNKHKSQLLEMSHESKHDPSHSADEGLESSQVIMNTQSHSVRLSLSNIDDELGDSLHGEESNALPISRRPRSAVIRSVKGSPAAGPLINARKR